MAMNFTPFPDEFLEEMEELSDAEYGRLVRWGQTYHLTGEKTKLCGNERFYAKRVQMQIDRYVQHYNEQLETRREAGKKGATARWQGKDSQPCERIATHTEPCDSIAADGKNGYTETKTKTNTKTKVTNVTKGNNAQARFSPPTVDEVAAYCQERKNGIDAQRFVDWYEANGWRVGKNPMKDWKAAVRTWEQRDGGTSNANSRDTAKSKWNLTYDVS